MRVVSRKQVVERSNVLWRVLVGRWHTFNVFLRNKILVDNWSIEAHSNGARLILPRQDL
ncbi:hypothetical protein BGX38DRAFT_1208470 [Terfezia claveryi]|nr:hypothetical protein BGX38DRAFT_1208470 [Terfezia claveryi]